jgi:DNA uptake protein ComE-like DNA-binding protein
MKRKSKPANSFLRLNRRERISVLALMLGLLVAVMVYILSFYYPAPSKFSLISLDSLDKNLVPKMDLGLDYDSTKKTNIAMLETFDPNTINKENLIRFGIPSHVASNWNKYIANGGTFKRPEDIQKVYGLRPADFQRLKPFIRIPFQASPVDSIERDIISLDINKADFETLRKAGLSDQEVKSFLAYRKSGVTFYGLEDLLKIRSVAAERWKSIEHLLDWPTRPKPLLPTTIVQHTIDINSADTTQLISVNGIGSVLATRIIKYRNQLGGFYHPHQMKEVYGLKDSVYQRLADRVIIKPTWSKILINTVDFKKLYHPYLSRKESMIIQNYIDQHRPIRSLDDLRPILAIDTGKWAKLAPYLAFD